jgi:hypothetical protein
VAVAALHLCFRLTAPYSQSPVVVVVAAVVASMDTFLRWFLTAMAKRAQASQPEQVARVARGTGVVTKAASLMTAVAVAVAVAVSRAVETAPVEATIQTEPVGTKAPL